ncbi:tryptophan--tRNA ligase [Patescibacteria group bacterium]|nr:tryptophan--tRNA ligase [Patescibacteria group bacterium]
MKKETKIFSGIKPSGDLTIGNYIGAISQWVEIQKDNECVFSIVDYHAITVKQDPADLRRRILDIAKTYLAAGIDPKKSIIFQQSQIPAHTELAWILNCTGTNMADLKKMTQFKDKAGDKQDGVSVGLFDYPVLMAADILLYDAQIVPVGEDQKQHVELTRDIAKRFNNEYGTIFTIPEARVHKAGARVMSLSDPTKKMAKSDESKLGYIALLDSPEVARKKIMKAVTDSGDDIDYDPINRPALANLLTIYARLGNREIPRLVKDNKGKGYGEFKKALADVVVKFLENFQEKFNSISDEETEKVLEDGKNRALAIAEEKMKKIRQAIGVR